MLNLISQDTSGLCYTHRGHIIMHASYTDDDQPEPSLELCYVYRGRLWHYQRSILLPLLPKSTTFTTFFMVLATFSIFVFVSVFVFVSARYTCPLQTTWWSNGAVYSERGGRRTGNYTLIKLEWPNVAMSYIIIISILAVFELVYSSHI